MRRIAAAAAGTLAVRLATERGGRAMGGNDAVLSHVGVVHPYVWWGQMEDPGYRPRPYAETRRTLAELHIEECIEHHFGVLEQRGFERGAPLRNDKRCVVPYQRSDAVVLVCAEGGVGNKLYLLAGRVEPPDAELRIVTKRWERSYWDSLDTMPEDRHTPEPAADIVARFGAFYLEAGTPAEAEELVAALAAATEAALGAGLAQQPVDVAALSRAAAQAMTEMQSRNRLAYARTRADAYFRDELWAWADTFYTRLAALAPLTDDDEQRQTHARERAAAEALAPVEREPGESDHAWLRRRVELYRELLARASAARIAWESGETANGRAAYDASMEMRRVQVSLWADIEGIRDRVLAHSATGVEDALLLLEVDPYFSYTGYYKTRILRALASYEFDAAQRERLLAVMLRALDHGGASNSPEGHRLARRYATNEFRRAVRIRLHSPDINVARRALAMVVKIKRPGLDASDRIMIRDLILVIGSSARYTPTWLQSVRERFGA